MGRCKEWAKVVGDEQVDARVLAMRHKDLPYVPKLQKATKPERVMTYRSAFSPDLPLIWGVEGISLSHQARNVILQGHTQDCMYLTLKNDRLKINLYEMVG